MFIFVTKTRELNTFSLNAVLRVQFGAAYMLLAFLSLVVFLIWEGFKTFSSARRVIYLLVALAMQKWLSFWKKKTILFSCAGSTFNYQLASYLGCLLEARFAGLSCSGFATIGANSFMVFFFRHIGDDLVSGLIVIRMPVSHFFCF